MTEEEEVIIKEELFDFCVKNNMYVTESSDNKTKYNLEKIGCGCCGDNLVNNKSLLEVFEYIKAYINDKKQI